MTDAGLRARAERLLNGDIRADDLSRLFLYARDRCDGREAVQEIGDFVAHHHERTKGLVTRTTRDWYVIAKFHGAIQEKQITRNSLPSFTTEYLDASFRRASHPLFRDKAHMSRKDAEKLLPTIKSKLAKLADGRLTLTAYISPAEMRLWNALVSTLQVRGAFDDEILTEGFAATLKSHGIIRKEEVRELGKLKTIIGLFAVSVMHNCKIVMTDKEIIKLEATPRALGGIAAGAAIPIQVKNGTIAMSSSMFTVTCKPEDWIRPELAANDWSNFELELTSDGRLGRLA